MDRFEWRNPAEAVRYAEGSVLSTITSPEVSARTQAQDPEARQQQAVQQELLQTLSQITQKKRRVEETMALLARETEAARIRRIWQIAWKLLILLGMAALLRSAGPGSVGRIWWLLFPIGRWWVMDNSSQSRVRAAQTLADAWEPRAVGALALALYDNDRTVRSVAANALRKLLPHVRASDAAYIDNRQWSALLATGTQWHGIIHSETVAMRLALLRALEQIGDERAIPTVTQMMLDDDPEVSTQAQVCLSFLEKHQRQTRERSTLLRSAMQETAPDQLLRAAIGTPAMQTPPEQLLRAESAE